MEYNNYRHPAPNPTSTGRAYFDLSYTQGGGGRADANCVFVRSTGPDGLEPLDDSHTVGHEQEESYLGGTVSSRLGATRDESIAHSHPVPARPDNREKHANMFTSTLQKFMHERALFEASQVTQNGNHDESQRSVSASHAADWPSRSRTAGAGGVASPLARRVQAPHLVDHTGGRSLDDELVPDAARHHTPGGAGGKLNTSTSLAQAPPPQTSALVVNSNATFTCKACGAKKLTGVYCIHCGAELPRVRECWSCGKETRGDFCGHCGAAERDHRGVAAKLSSNPGASMHHHHHQPRTFESHFRSSMTATTPSEGSLTQSSILPHPTSSMVLGAETPMRPPTGITAESTPTDGSQVGTSRRDVITAWQTMAANYQ